MQKLNQRQAWWALYLSRFNFTLKYVLETKTEKVNEFNRKIDWKVGVEKDNKNQSLIKEEWICCLAEVMIEGLEVYIMETIKIARGKNKEIVRIVEEIKKIGVKE